VHTVSSLEREETIPGGGIIIAMNAAAAAEPTTTTMAVSGMTCSHCVAAVTAEVSKLDGVVAVTVDLDSGAVTVEANGPIDPE
jgi:copper chaperone